MPRSAPEILLPYPHRQENDHNLTPSMWSALGHLLRAHELARGLNRSKWEFAVEIEALERAGSDHNDLRALVCQGLVEHAEETTPPRAKSRRFRPTPGLRLTPQTCFVLSDWGLAVASQQLIEKSGRTNGSATLPAPSLRPVWDETRRELRLGNLVLKRFRRPAKNQEAILAAFQEDGWPARIDSPITGGSDTSAPERVHNAVKRLNRQISRFIRFESDGSGEGVMWMLRPTSGPGSNQDRTLTTSSRGRIFCQSRYGASSW